MYVQLAGSAIVVALGLIYFCLKKQPAKLKNQPEEREISFKREDKDTQHSSSTVAEEQPEPKVQKKKKKKGPAMTSLPTKTNKQLQEQHGQHFYGTISLRSSKNLTTVTSLAIKNSKILIGNSKNQLVLFDLKKWKPHTPCNQHYYTTLDNNCATAVAISPHFYFAALDFQKTISYFQFKGEGGVYFKEVKKFPRNIFKSNQGSIHVPDSQKFIVTTGMESDTSINVWSMSGDKLTSIGTYQIQHYDITYTQNLVLVRGWTSQIKAFQLHTDKDGAFTRIDKGFHLTLKEKPNASVIDTLGLHACAITGQGQLIKLWNLVEPSHPFETTIDSCQISIDQPKYCSIATLKMQNERLKTIVAIASDTKMVLLDRHLKPIKEFQGISVQQLHCFGASRSAVFATVAAGKLSVWDFTKLANQQPEYVRP